MTETATRLSDAFHGEHFAEAVETWNIIVAGNEALEANFMKLARKRVKKAVRGKADDDYMTREIVTDALEGATSAEAYGNSYYGWTEVGLDDELDERGVRLARVSKIRSTLLADLCTDVDDSFERYALDRYLPRQKPTPVADLLARVAATKQDLVNFDNFTQTNAGNVFQRIGVFAFHAGKFTGEGIYIKNNRIVVPVVEDSVRYARYAHPHKIMEVAPDPRYSLDPTELDGGFAVQDPSQLLRMSVFWKSFSNRQSVWSVGELPESPLVYDEDKEGKHFPESVEIFEAHLATLRVLTKTALEASYDERL
ncbi:MAG: hypothetical protein WAS36_02425 [Candidatus Saccharimonadales bacterium]